jgi:hypothetical protein
VENVLIVEADERLLRERADQLLMDGYTSARLPTSTTTFESVSIAQVHC